MLCNITALEPGLSVLWHLKSWFFSCSLSIRTAAEEQPDASCWPFHRAPSACTRAPAHPTPTQCSEQSLRASGSPDFLLLAWCENRGNRWPLRDKLLLFVYFGFCLQATQCTAWFINSFWAACEVLTSPELTILAWCCPRCNPCSAPSPRITGIPVNPELFYFFSLSMQISYLHKHFLDCLSSHAA